MFSAWLHAARGQFAYRLDRFLRMHGLVQALILLGTTASLVLLFAGVLVIAGGTPETHTLSDHLWWTLGRFSDGGTMYPDQGARVRTIAVIVTWTAIFVVQFMTGAVTAKLTDRLGQLRAGRSPVVERGHILVLGFDTRVPLLARELARSRQRWTLVVLAEASVTAMDLALRSVSRIARSRLRIETRSGDPRDELTLLRVAADRARSVVILAPEELDDEAAGRFGFQALLALRRIAPADFPGQVIVETRHAGDEELYAAAADSSAPNTPALPLIQMAGDDVIARVLALSVRQPGVYFVLRELMTFRGSELYFEPVPKRLAGKKFGTIHASVIDAIAVGFKPRGKPPVVNPPDDRIIGEDDELIVLEQGQGAMRVARHQKLPEPVEATQSPQGEDAPISLVVLGDNRALPEFVTELANALPDKSRIKVFAPRAPVILQPTIDRITRVQVACEDADPTALARGPTREIIEADETVILGAATPGDADADAQALETLVCLRHEERKRGAKARRLITELRNLSSAMHVGGSSDDFLVSTEILGLLMGQVMVTPELYPVLHDDLLNPGGNDVFLHPRELYAGEAKSTFAQVMSAARRRREVAIGMYLPSRRAGPLDLRALHEGLAENDESSPVWLVPHRHAHVPADALIVVLGIGSC
ncbi:MAG: hypothetical protein HY898_29515 [Deltaproteobacteria bacterium]|nr:hypothetical protein [Deltaproteobacteria bacterium]